MVELGYGLSSEEHPPLNMVRNAHRAEEAGFAFALISDHFHPWSDKQGQSPFVWSVIGGIAATTQNLKLGTAVTCPTIRTHPAIIAQAAATCAAMMPERFFLGVGTGENLNEHVVGAGWPHYEQRAEMLDEAVQIIRLLWEGEVVTHEGEFYTVEAARIFTLPDQLPPIIMAASGDNSAELAGEIADGFMSTAPDEKLVDAFRESGGTNGAPIYGKVTGCYAPSTEQAVKTAHHWWAFTALPGQLNQEIRSVNEFDDAVKLVTPEHIKETGMPLGANAKAWKEDIQKYIDAGYTHVCLQQIGPDQAAFIEFAQREILPEFA